MTDDRQAGLTGNTRKADSQYVEDALGIEDEYESELAAVQVALTRYEVTPYEYARRRSEIAARAFLRLAAAHYIDADLCRDPVIRQRATRVAEYLLSKLKPPAVPRLPAEPIMTARQLLELLEKAP